MDDDDFRTEAEELLILIGMILVVSMLISLLL